MKQESKYWLIGSALLCISLLLHVLHVSHALLAFVKCVTLAYSIVCLTIAIVSHTHIRRKYNAWLYGLGVLILCSYTLLAADTYLFHVITWFPGIIRYPLFSLYGIAYLIFVIPGILLYMGGNPKESSHEM